MKLNKFFILTAAVAALSSCRPDLLDTTPYDKASSESMWKNENLCITGVNAIYSRFRSNQLGKEIWEWEAMCASGTHRDNVNDLLNGTASYASGRFSSFWKEHYAGVNQANDAIVHLPGANISDELKGRLMAESKILRAYFYSRLNSVFKGVPYYDAPFEVEEATKPCNSEAEVWDACEKDLTEAIAEPNLPDRYADGDSDWGRMTKSVAYAVRGKVRLWKKDWAGAEADFKKLGDLGHKLFVDAKNPALSYKMLFKEANEHSDEAILSLQCIDGQGETYSNQAHFRYGGRNAFGQGWNSCLASTDFADTYENADGSEFKWEDYIPEWNTLDVKDREIFFIRNSDVEVIKAELIAAGMKASKPEEMAAVEERAQAISKFTRNYIDSPERNFSDKAKALYSADNNEARILKAFANRDPRLAQTMITPYSQFFGTIDYQDPHFYTSRWPFINDFKDTQYPFDYRTDSQKQFYYLFRKFVGEGNKEFSDRKTSPIDLPLIRYASCLINLAEALNEQGKTSEAIEVLNQVRKRAGAALLSTGLSQADARVRIQKEFRWETAGEGVSFFEDIRWGTWKESKFANGVEKGAGLKEVWGLPTFNYSWEKALDSSWPIPKHEIDMNPALDRPQDAVWH